MYNLWSKRACFTFLADEIYKAEKVKSFEWLLPNTECPFKVVAMYGKFNYNHFLYVDNPINISQTQVHKNPIFFNVAITPIPSLWYLINSCDLHSFIKGSFNFSPENR